MKQVRSFTVVLFALSMLLTPGRAQEAPKKAAPLKPAASPSAALLKQWNEIGRKLIAMSEDFPENKYDFKAASSVRSFAERLIHAAASNYYFTNLALGQKAPGEEDPPRTQFKDKAALVAYMRKSFADGAAAIKSKGDKGILDLVVDPFGFDDPEHAGKTQIRLCDLALNLIEHSGEVYGQLTVYYRVAGLIPPESRPKKAAQEIQPTLPGGKIRTYYLAAVETDWDYAPSGMDMMTGTEFHGQTKIWTEHTKDRIGKIYRKAIFREYTDDTFTAEKKRPKEWEHLGIMGPLIRAEVGDTIVIQFRNNASQPYSMHPHGVSYERDSEGTPYPDTSMDAAGLVSPGQSHTYVWNVPERAGPGEDDGSSVVWLYHSHNWEPKDVNAGLIGPMVITRRGAARADGSPKDVDREFAMLFMLIDENTSHYLQRNIDTYIQDPKSVNKLDVVPIDIDGNLNFAGSGFAGANYKASINGYMFGNLPMPTMKRGEHVRWYVMTMGGQANYHTPHWHGNVVTLDKHHTDIFSILPAQFVTADMIPDHVGTWMFHCHISEHMEMGMMAMYQVLP
jgi:FtsP/CotA-like multicopper oxidase with cupredoxin domain